MCVYVYNNNSAISLEHSVCYTFILLRLHMIIMLKDIYIYTYTQDHTYITHIVSKRTAQIFVPTEIPLKFLTVRVFVFSLLIIHIFILCDCSFKNLHTKKKISYIHSYMAILTCTPNVYTTYQQHKYRVLLLHIST